MVDPGSLRRLTPVPTYGDHPATAAHDVVGTDLKGRTVSVVVGEAGTSTLFVFLSPNCDGCLPLWGVPADPDGHGLGGLRVVVLTRNRTRREARAVRRLTPRGAEAAVLDSPQAWADYRVHGGPFFVLVAGRGSGAVVLTEGVAWGVEQVAEDVARARRTAR